MSSREGFFAALRAYQEAVIELDQAVGTTPDEFQRVWKKAENARLEFEALRDEYRKEWIDSFTC